MYKGKSTNENPYFRARKAAALYNDKLSSRELAADLLGVSSGTLANYELGITKAVPVESVMRMADLYNAPELMRGYCKYECPIGKQYPLATEQKGIEGIALRLVRELDKCRIGQIKTDLIEVCQDGVIDDNEKPVLKRILGQLDELVEIISEMKIAGTKVLER